MVFHIEFENRNESCLLRIHGAIDMVDAIEFYQVMEKAIAENNSLLVLDFSDVPFIDSSGVGAIAKICATLKETGGRINVFGINPELIRLLGGLSITENFKVCPSEEQALMVKKTTIRS